MYGFHVHSVHKMDTRRQRFLQNVAPGLQNATSGLPNVCPGLPNVACGLLHAFPGLPNVAPGLLNAAASLKMLSPGLQMLALGTQMLPPGFQIMQNYISFYEVLIKFQQLVDGSYHHRICCFHIISVYEIDIRQQGFCNALFYLHTKLETK